MKNMPNLAGALRLEAAPGQKLCIHCSAGFVLDTPGSTLMFGTISGANDEEALEFGPNASLEPFIHSWAEYKGLAFAPTTLDRTGGKLVGMEPTGYYRVNRMSDIKSLSRPALLKIARQIGLSRHLRLGVPTRDLASVGSSLLDAAGKAYRVVEHALLPA